MICREMERDRIKDQEGVLYHQFNTQIDFEMIEKYARVGEKEALHFFFHIERFSLR